MMSLGLRRKLFHAASIGCLDGRIDDNVSGSVVMSMTVEVPIPDDLIPRLDQKARRAGLDREQYVSALVSRDLAAPKHSMRFWAAFAKRLQLAAYRFGPAGPAHRTTKSPLEIAGV